MHPGDHLKEVGADERSWMGASLIGNTRGNYSQMARHLKYIGSSPAGQANQVQTGASTVVTLVRMLGSRNLPSGGEAHRARVRLLSKLRRSTVGDAVNVVMISLYRWVHVVTAGDSEAMSSALLYGWNASDENVGAMAAL